MRYNFVTSMKRFLLARYEAVLTHSLRAALREQELDGLAAELERAVPDIRKQYSGFEVDSEYLRLKVRGQHAFQVWLARKGVEGIDGDVVDIGDSAGTHVAYLKALAPGPRRYLSVNLDKAAVARIRAKGLDAVEGRAENLAAAGVQADVALCFETLEHVPNPFAFLHDLYAGTRCRRLVVTVPYVRRTRLGLHHIRAGLKKPVSAEGTHLHEFSPEDLRLLFLHCGWRPATERIYLQYPKLSPLRALAPLWRRRDFEGFYGAVLERDGSWSDLYGDWS